MRFFQELDGGVVLVALGEHLSQFKTPLDRQQRSGELVDESW